MVDATPYPWPYDGSLTPAKTALVLVAAQQAFAGLDPTGRVRGACVELRQAAERAGVSVVLVRLGRTPATPARITAIPVVGSSGWACLPGCEADSSTLVVDAPALDGFYGTGLEAALWARGISHLLLAGFGTETAVHSTLRSANDRGFECLTVDDACADVEPGIHGNSMGSIMMSGGIFGCYAPLAALLPELAALAHPAVR